MTSLDPDLLRTFVAFADAGSLARAAAIVGRTPSAVTAQMQRLEETVGLPILVPAGRGRSLTEAGERLLGHARRILAVNSEAWLSMAGAKPDGHVAIGMIQDFADTRLPSHLNVFARSNPRVRLDLHVGRSNDLSEAYKSRKIDILIAIRQGVERDEATVVTEAMHWLSAPGGLVGLNDELPLAVLDPPCGFRDAALAALERANRRYRIAATSSSVAGLQAAVRAGVAVTVRTARWIGPGIQKASSRLSLPKLPRVEFSLRVHQGSGDASRRLAAVLADGLRR